MRICITGGPKTGKTTLANRLVSDSSVADWGTPSARFGGPTRATQFVHHTDDLISMGWSEASEEASKWLDEPGPWIIEGVAVVRALRKWREAHPGEPAPVDRVIRLVDPYASLSKGQQTMTRGEETIWREVEGWLGRRVEYPDLTRVVGVGR